MIVRIMGEGQFEMPEESLARLNELDDALEAAWMTSSRSRPRSRRYWRASGAAVPGARRRVVHLRCGTARCRGDRRRGSGTAHRRGPYS